MEQYRGAVSDDNDGDIDMNDDTAVLIFATLLGVVGVLSLYHGLTL